MHPNNGRKKCMQFIYPVRDWCLEYIRNIYNSIRQKDITLSTKVCIVKVWFFQYLHADVRVGP